MLNAMFDKYSERRGCYVTSNPNAVSPLPAYRRLAAEYGLSAFRVAMDAAELIRGSGYHVYFSETTGAAVMHPGELEDVEARLYDAYLTQAMQATLPR